MISIFIYIFFLLNLILIISKKKSNVIAFLFWFVLFLAYAGNIRTGYADLTHYRERYYNGSNGTYFTDKAYIYFADLFSNKNISFQVFLAAIFIASSLLLYFVAKKLKCNFNLLICLYALYYYFYTMEVLRFFLSASIAVVAYYYLHKNNQKIFLILIFIAYLFHEFIIFLLPFVFFYNVKEKKGKYKFLIGFALILIIMNLMHGNESTYLLNFLTLILGEEIVTGKIRYYFNTSTRLGFLLYDMYFVFNIIIIYNIKILKDKYIQLNKELRNYIELAYQQNLYCVVFLPFIMFNATFSRYIVFTCNLNFIALAALYREFNKKGYSLKTKEFYRIISALVGFTVLWWILKENVLSFYEALLPNIFNGIF